MIVADGDRAQAVQDGVVTDRDTFTEINHPGHRWPLGRMDTPRQLWPQTASEPIGGCRTSCEMWRNNGRLTIIQAARPSFSRKVQGLLRLHLPQRRWVFGWLKTPLVPPSCAAEWERSPSIGVANQLSTLPSTSSSPRWSGILNRDGLQLHGDEIVIGPNEPAEMETSTAIQKPMKIHM